MTGEDLKAQRMARRLSRPALAAMAGLHPDSVKYWERKGSLDLRGYAVVRMLAALGLEALTKRHRTRIRGNYATITRAWDGVLGETSASPRNRACGARTRKGAPCRAKPIPGKARCKFHGGLSTGPRTPEGRARVAEAQRRRWRGMANLGPA